MKEQNYTEFINFVLEWADGKGLIGEELKDKTLNHIIINFNIYQQNFLKNLGDGYEELTKILVLIICYYQQTKEQNTNIIKWFNVIPEQPFEPIPQTFLNLSNWIYQNKLNFVIIGFKKLNNGQFNLVKLWKCFINIIENEQNFKIK